MGAKAASGGIRSGIFLFLAIFCSFAASVVPAAGDIAYLYDILNRLVCVILASGCLAGAEGGI